MPFRRRRVLMLGSALLTGVASRGAAADDQPVPRSIGTERPTIDVPPGATDCHHHIYDDRFPVAPGVTSMPANATAQQYLLVQRRLGTSRHVAVQPSAYGVDNSCLLDALRQFGPSARGIAVVNIDVADDELKRLNEAGVRGIRFNFAPAGATTREMMMPLARRIAGMGWHVQLHATADDILAMKDVLSALPCPLVIDHMGRLPEPAGTSHPAFALLLTLLGAGRAWVKLSAPYADTKVGAPIYADTSAVARAYVKAVPGRVLWGSDWPHPSKSANHRPDDTKLLDLLADWAPDAEERHRILVKNPSALFGFPS